MGTVHTALLRVSGGRVGRSFRGAPVLLLTTTGRKTGQERTIPLMYVEHDGGWAIVGSNGGRDSHPAWVHNLRAKPSATVTVGGKTHDVRADFTDDTTRAQLWPRFTAMYTGYDGYEKATDRKIEIVVLRPT